MSLYIVKNKGRQIMRLYSAVYVAQGSLGPRWSPHIVTEVVALISSPPPLLTLTWINCSTACIHFWKIIHCYICTVSEAQTCSTYVKLNKSTPLLDLILYIVMYSLIML